ncbi:MAG: R3H domain-containing nucleic acid-binding protein [Candidatus Spechtbacterales bacterium]
MATKTTHILKDLLDRMGFLDANIQEQEAGGRVKVDVRVSDARDLIGERGATLSMLQHILRRIVAKHTFPTPLIDIDVNSYKRMREDVLSDFARDVGSRVRLEKKAVELDPMPAFDRRVIHLTLANFSDITTESIGEGDARYIVIRPYP